MVELVRISGWHDILCRLLEEGKPFATACAFAQIPATRVFNEMNNNPQFKERVQKAEKSGRGAYDSGESSGNVSGVKLAPMRSN